MSSEIENRIRGSRSGYIVHEFFTNTAHFPIINIFIELLLEGPSIFFQTDSALYTLSVASIIQAFFLGSWQYAGKHKPLAGNLIGPAIYSLVEMLFEGTGFFTHANHIAYWAFSFTTGMIQEIRYRLAGRSSKLLIVLENIVRTNIIFAGYWIFESLTEPKYASIGGFFSDRGHIFVAIVVPLVGLMVGLANANAETYLLLLRQTASKLTEYSQWFLGRDLLSKAVIDPSILTLKRRERALVFMDIRGFTRWSEHEPPEKVVNMLNAYYEAVESVWVKYQSFKSKFTADEIMCVFPSVENAVMAALDFRLKTNELLSTYRLAAGIGVHSGTLVEGVLGSREIKGYDIIGDTVNTCKRICTEAAGGEILISESIYAVISSKAKVSESKQIHVKGKSEPVTVYSLISL